MSIDEPLLAPAGEPGKERGEMRLIARAAAILRALANAPGGASLGEIAKATGLARSTVQRVIDALVVEQFVSAGAGACGLKLGLEIARLASFVQMGPREQLRPFMESLMGRVQETVDLTILDEHGVCVRAGHHCAQPLMRRLGVAATARASVWVHSTADDVAALVTALQHAKAVFADGAVR